MSGLPYSCQSIDESDILAVSTVLRSPWITQGPSVESFEAAICEATGARYAVAVSSGTAALHLACMDAGAVPGSYGVTSPISFVASANCLEYHGAYVEFCDVDSTTGLMDVDELASRNAAHDVIIPVDFAGQPADLPAIGMAAFDRTTVIEDAAHSLGGSYDSPMGRVMCGSCTHTDMAILSFHPVKAITTGEGGAITTNDQGIAECLRSLRSHGIVQTQTKREPWLYEQRSLGYNYRITDYACALGESQLRKLGKFIERRRELADRYDRAFADEPFAGHITPLVQLPGNHSARHLYVIRLITEVGRADLYRHLRNEGINAQVHYIPITRQPYYRDRYDIDPSDYPGAEEYYAGCLSLPLFPEMDEADVDRVVGAIREWMR